MCKPENFPLAVIAERCREAIARGGFILQKWTCVGCGQRITGGNVNVITERGHCQHCNTNTDITVHGCNYMLIQPSRPMTVAELETDLGLNEGTRQ